MNTQIETPTNQNLHHWMLWISPSNEQTFQLKNWPSDLKERVLTLHPRQPEHLCRSILSAIECGYYAMITLPTDCLCEMDKWKVQQAATRQNTVLAWKN